MLCINTQYSVTGSGLGLRRALTGPLSDPYPSSIDFMEVAPENWINVGGRHGRTFKAFTERYPFVCHGLSLSIGSPAPLDETFILKIKSFLHTHQIRCYSEHLSYCSDDGHLYDLMPIPFTEEAVHHVANRIKRVQDLLERKIAIENISYYAAPGKEMDEIQFLTAILQAADCNLLLDLNNIYVNSINHCYDAETFLKALPGERIAYAHIAGHTPEAEDLIIDTHGTDVIDPVWHLLETAYQHFGSFPTLLERDFNFPTTAQLLSEVEHIKTLQNKYHKLLTRTA